MHTDLDALVISLDRTPDRLRQFRERNQNCDIAFSHLSGVDGLRIPLETRSNRAIMDRDLGWSDGAIGNALSHRNAWQRCAESDRLTIVAEDDAILAPNLGEMIPHVLGELVAWDIVLLGFNTDSVLDLRLVDGMDLVGVLTPQYPSGDLIATLLQPARRPRTFRLNNAFGSCAYAVSPAGADRLLAMCFPLTRPTVKLRGLPHPLLVSSLDGLMNTIFGQIQAHVCLPPLAYTPNDRDASLTISPNQDIPETPR